MGCCFKRQAFEFTLACIFFEREMDVLPSEYDKVTAAFRRPNNIGMETIAKLL